MSTSSIETKPSSCSLSNIEQQTPLSDDFVHVSPTSSFDDGKQSVKGSLAEGDSKRFESHREDDLLERAIALGKENDRLKETLKHNNFVLQQYTKDFTDLQEQHRANNENIKREHQRAKEVVTKLRDDNRTLKGELKKAQSGKIEDLERENASMKEQISCLHKFIQDIDSDLKNCEMSDNLAEYWQQLLGSLASYNYKSGTMQRNEESLAREIQGEQKNYGSKNCNQRSLDVETEILKVDFEKVKVEKQYLEGVLSKRNEEINQLKESCERVKEEKEQLRKMLDEQHKINLKKDKDHKEELTKKIKEIDVLEQKLESQDYEDVHDVCKQKFLAMQNEYFRLEKQLNNMEERENSLCAKEKAIEKEKGKFQQQAEAKLKATFEAELESRSKSFLEETSQLHSELKEARGREEALQEQLDQVQNDFCEKEESLRGQVCQLINENDALRIKNEKLTELNARRDALYEDRIKGMERHKNDKDKEKSNIIDLLQNQLGMAKEEVKKYQDQDSLHRNELENLRSQHDHLMKEYDELLNLYNEIVEDNKKRSSNKYAEIESYKGKLDDMTCHLTGLGEACEKKDAVISDLQKRLRTAEEQNSEELPVIKQQMEVYYNDFKAEREARERQHADILNLREQNQRLVEANRDLQRELDNLENNHQMAEMQRRHLSHQGSSHIHPETFREGFHTRRGGEPAQRMEGYREGYDWTREQQREAHDLEEAINCPGCNLEFWNFGAIQQHLLHCPAALQRNRQPIDDNQCPLCGDEYPDADTLEIHVQECLRNSPD